MLCLWYNLNSLDVLGLAWGGNWQEPILVDTLMDIQEPDVLEGVGLAYVVHHE